MVSSPRTQIQKKYYSLKKISQNFKKEMQRSTCGTITLNKSQLLTREFIEVEGKYFRISLIYELFVNFDELYITDWRNTWRLGKVLVHWKMKLLEQPIKASHWSKNIMDVVDLLLKQVLSIKVTGLLVRNMVMVSLFHPKENQCMMQHGKKTWNTVKELKHGSYQLAKKLNTLELSLKINKLVKVWWLPATNLSITSVNLKMANTTEKDNIRPVIANMKVLSKMASSWKANKWWMMALGTKEDTLTWGNMVKVHCI